MRFINKKPWDRIIASEYSKYIKKIIKFKEICIIKQHAVLGRLLCNMWLNNNYYILRYTEFGSLSLNLIFAHCSLYYQSCK